MSTPAIDALQLELMKTVTAAGTDCMTVIMALTNTLASVAVEVTEGDQERAGELLVMTAACAARDMRNGQAKATGMAVREGQVVN